jgi:hypothetical protein
VSYGRSINVNDTPACCDDTAGDTANRARPRPIVTVRPEMMPRAAPKATSLVKCRFTWTRDVATYEASA